MDDIMNAERERTGNYGNDFFAEFPERKCPICGSKSPRDIFRTSEGKIVGCTECLLQDDIYDFSNEEWEEMKNNV